MKEEYKYFNKTQAKILRVLYRKKIPLSIYEIAKEAEISYPTAKKYVIDLKDCLKKDKKKGVVSRFAFRFELLGEK